MAVKSYYKNNVPFYIGNFAEMATTTGDTGSEFYTKDTEKIYRYNGTTWDDITNDITGVSKISDGTNDLAINTDGSIDTNSVNIIESGIATGGSQLYIDDTNKSFEENMFLGAIADIKIGTKHYLRSVIGNTETRIGINPIQGASATAILGEHAAGEVTIVTVAQGIGGNEYTCEVVLSAGQNMALSASLTGLVLTVYLGTDAGGLADNAKNTATAVAVVIDQVPEFTATMTGAGGVIATTVNPVAFTGGIAIVSASVGCEYQIKKPTSNIIYGLSTLTKPTTNLPVSKIYYEMDTGLSFMWDGSAWRSV